MSNCQICKNGLNNKDFIVREMMFGFQDEFGYFECAKCGCLQIKEIPKNISKYYPDNYYSYAPCELPRDSFFKSLMIHLRARHRLYSKKIIPILKTEAFGSYQWLRKPKLKFNSTVLDVGCGSGSMLLDMRRLGFSNDLIGVDPFIPKDIIYDNGVKILKKELFEIEQQFDFIILHHSFEHMTEPLNVFKELYRLLKPNRYVLICIPIASSFAWRHYGVNWVNLDAPRHYHLHTPTSMEILAEETGFQVKEIVYDSVDLQFWGSEQYLKGIPLRSPDSYAENKETSIFSKKEIASFQTRANELNKNNDGDFASFYLHKPLN